MTRRSPPTLVALTLLASLATPLAADQKADIPVSRVVLYSSGVAYFEHAGQVEGDATLALRFKTDQINDVLKSMVFADADGGTVRSVDYTSNDPVERALRSFGIDLSGDPSLPDLLKQLRGAQVVVTAPEEVIGSVLNVQARQVVRGDPPVTLTEHFLTLVTESGIRTLPMDSIERLELTDTGLRDELDKALALLVESRDTERKALDIHFTGNGKRRVHVGYLVEAPVWKTSYRLDLTPLSKETKPLLQGWAIVENTSDSDWTNIQLSLVSGRPVSFVQDLYTPLFAERQVVQPTLTASLKPRTYAEGFEREEQAAALGRKRRPAMSSIGGMSGTAARAHEPWAGMPAADVAPAPAVPAEAMALAELSDEGAGGMDVGASIRAAASGGSVGELFQFTLRTPIDMPRRRSAMIPIINQDADAEKVSIYSESVHATHPLNGVVLNNDTGLKMLAGPVTVFDGGSYAGDAQLDHLAPGDKRLLSYAVDLAVSVDPSVKSSSEITSGKIVRGVLDVSRVSRWEQTYSIKNKDEQKRTIIVEHPFVAGRELMQPEVFDEKTPSLYRFRVAVDAGTTGQLIVAEQQTTSETIAILNTRASNLVYYQRSAEIPQSVRQALGMAIGMKNQISQLEQQLRDKELELRKIKEGQGRLRENLKTVNSSSQLGKRYLQKLNTEENQIDQLDDEIASLREQLNAKRDELANYLNDLDVG